MSRSRFERGASSAQGSKRIKPQRRSRFTIRFFDRHSSPFKAMGYEGEVLLTDATLPEATAMLKRAVRDFGDTRVKAYLSRRSADCERVIGEVLQSITDEKTLVQLDEHMTKGGDVLWFLYRVPSVHIGRHYAHHDLNKVCAPSSAIKVAWLTPNRAVHVENLPQPHTEDSDPTI